MRDKTFLWLAVMFLAGLVLTVLSYARFMESYAFLVQASLQLGVGLMVAAAIGASVDVLFQERLVTETQKAVVRVADDFETRIDKIGQGMEVSLERAKASTEQMTNDMAKGVSKLGDEVSRIGKDSKAVFARVPIMACCMQSGILNIYQSRSHPDVQHRMLELLMGARNRVDIMGISLRSFFQGGGDLNNSVKAILNDINERQPEHAKWRVLVIDPDCEQAKLRSRREEEDTTIAYEDGNLYPEVNRTINLIRTQYRDCDIQLRTFYGAPSCFLLLVDDVILVEQYHYGSERGQRAGELVPLIEFEKGSKMYRELEGHFEYMWNELSHDPYKQAPPSMATEVTATNCTKSALSRCSETPLPGETSAD